MVYGIPEVVKDIIEYESLPERSLGSVYSNFNIDEYVALKLYSQCWDTPLPSDASKEDYKYKILYYLQNMIFSKNFLPYLTGDFDIFDGDTLEYLTSFQTKEETMDYMGNLNHESMIHKLSVINTSLNFIMHFTREDVSHTVN